MQVSVVLPTYNERDNIAELISRLRTALGQEAELVVVDDDSPDGTWQVAERLAQEDPNLLVLRRTEERGLTSAICAGIARAQGDVIAWMDCDLSMPPEAVPELVAALGHCHIAVGSRYVAGGRDEGHSLMARAFSRAINLFAGLLLGFAIRDYTSGFIAIRQEVLKLLSLRGDYGEYSIDLLHRARRAGFGVVELPFTCAPRLSGLSKTSNGFWGYLQRGIKYVATILRLRLERGEGVLTVQEKG